MAPQHRHGSVGIGGDVHIVAGVSGGQSQG